LGFPESGELCFFILLELSVGNRHYLTPSCWLGYEFRKSLAIPYGIARLCSLSRFNLICEGEKLAIKNG
jgi:hypothetical protein